MELPIRRLAAAVQVRRKLICGAMVVAIGLDGAAISQAVALGAPADVRDEARQHYERALELVDEGLYAKAVVEFRRAYELAPRATVLYNLGLAYAADGKPAEAVDAFRRYLVEGGADISPERRAEVEQEIRNQEARVARLTVQTNVPGAAIRVDGVLVGKAPLSEPLRIDIGEHRLTASLEGYRTAEQAVAIAGGETRQITLALEEQTPVVRLRSAGPGPQPGPSAADVGRTQRLLGYGAGALGLAAAATSAGIYLWNRNQYDRWRAADQALADNPAAPDFVQRREANDALADSIRRATIANVAVGVGAGVLLTAAIVLIATSPAAREGTGARPKHALQVGPGTAGYVLTW